MSLLHALLVLGCAKSPAPLAGPKPVPLPPDVDLNPRELPASGHWRARNPFAGARFYVNPHYRDAALRSRQDAPPSLHAAIEAVADTPTAIWLDRIAAIEGVGGRPSLRDHLDGALELHESGEQPVTIVLVLYDLPDRDCAAGASAGELRLSEDGMRRYKREFVDPIVGILREPRYRPLRVVAILEPDSLPNLVTNLETHETCRDAANAYREGVAYAVEQLAGVPNAYTYLDIAHSGWLGWDLPAKAAAIYKGVLREAGGVDRVVGFATNTSNYTPLTETFDPYVAPGANADLVEDYYGWNRIVDEHKFVDALRSHFPEHGFVIDTGRNGWGGRVDATPRDGRSDRGNWCNVAGAGLGARPQADPRRGVHAYFWVKPPGESDGAGAPPEGSPDQRFDPMCAPGGTTDAMPGAPPAGEWFTASFLELVRNAHPPF